MILRRLPYLYRRFISTLLLSGLCCNGALALDVIVFYKPNPHIDHRKEYPIKLLTEVMRRTEREYGPFKITFNSVTMERERLFEELKNGKEVNVARSVTQPKWEQHLIGIMIPLDMGMQSWRLALTDQKKLERVGAIKSLDELKKLRVGVGSAWSTYTVLQENGFNVVSGNNYEGLFDMLAAGRFDYLPRGVNEIFDELDQFKAKQPSLTIESTFALYTPLPTLFFVSPNTPRLAARISAGMETMLKDGSLQRFMLNHHNAWLLRAQLCSRRVFEIPNPLVSAALLARKEIWFDPLNPKNRICPAAKLAKQKK